MAAIALATACALAAPAGAATTNYPGGGSGFDGGTQGWTPGPTSCDPLELPLLCEATATHSPAAGNPGGAISGHSKILINLLDVFSAHARWTSPEFTVTGQVTGAELTLDRAFDPGSLIDLAPDAAYTVTLLDKSAGTSAELLTETGIVGASPYTGKAAGATVFGGRTYQLRIETTTNTTLAGLGLPIVDRASDLRFDNVRLAVVTQDGSGPGGPGGPDGPGTGGDGGAGGAGGKGGAGGSGAKVSPGVRIVRGPLSGAGIASLMRSLNLNAEVGSGPGGSLVPLSQCTIVGTPRADRIVGGRGNEVICGLGGNDSIRGGGGRDVIDGANGNDRTFGGPGGDLVISLRGNDRAGGGGGHDRLGGGAGNDRIAGGSGNDLLIGRRNVDRLFGGAGNDRLKAKDRGRDVVRGGRGRDIGFLDGVDRRFARHLARIR